MAGGTLFFEHGVGGAHASARVDAGISGEGVQGDPSDGEHGDEDTQRKLRALEGRGAPEIVQVDALREFFGRARSGHFISPAYAKNDSSTPPTKPKRPGLP